MANHHDTMNKCLTNERGQVAIFVALIFQVLFLFFAMVINVGLLVHHKINLQNSVDFAAYYGAAKQAENLNVIAHTNYQIRQSWKLLVFRFRQLGTAGEMDSMGLDHPFVKSNQSLMQPEEVGPINGSHPNFYQNPPFCITYSPFKPMPAENICRDSGMRASNLSIFGKPPVIAGFLGFTSVIAAATESLRKSIFGRCEEMGSFNYVMLGKYVAAYNIDQASRMEVIKKISDSMSAKTDTFTDVDGQDVRAGMLATLRKNLTGPNESSLKDEEVQTVNSLGLGTCAQTGSSGFKNWLQPIRIMPGYTYIDTQCDPGGNSFGRVAKELNPSSPPAHMANAGPTQAFFQMAEVLKNFIGFDQSNIHNKYNASIGVEKNPWCMAYVGIKASTTPKIPFSPLGSVVLTARAVAKPFGGRIGPWYGNVWPSGAAMSNSPIGDLSSKVDKLLPPRVIDNSVFSNAESYRDPHRASNHSRFIGDEFGQGARKYLGYMGRAIFRLDARWQTGVTPPSNTATPDDGTSPNFRHWDHLPSFITEGAGDIMAWNASTNAPSDMRALEMMSILPDQFDVTYYSIEPDFYKSYYTRLQSGLGATLSLGNDLRPDLGYRKGSQFEKFSIKNQYGAIGSDEQHKVLMLDWKTEFLWSTDKAEQVYTGWVPKGLTDFSVDTTRFAKCDHEIEDEAPGSPGSCVKSGGTTGYAVKIISSEYLKRSNLPLGGASTSGPILNQPPDGF